MPGAYTLFRLINIASCLLSRGKQEFSREMLLTCILLYALRPPFSLELFASTAYVASYHAYNLSSSGFSFGDAVALLFLRKLYVSVETFLSFSSRNLMSSMNRFIPPFSVLAPRD